MQLPPRKKNQDMPTVAQEQESKGPQYPYGLEISLENETLDKLSMKSLPKVGIVLSIEAKAKVTRVSESAEAQNKRKSIALQITDLAFESESKEDTATKLYGA
jgi:hypothetical protein